MPANALRNIIRKVLPQRVRDVMGLVRSYLKLTAENRRKLRTISDNDVGWDERPFRFSSDGLCTIHNADFVHEPRFLRAYNAGKATDSWGGVDPLWRAHVLCWAAQWAATLGGDFVECGVNRGGGSRMILDYLGGFPAGRSFFLLDTFSGFVPTQLSKEEQVMVGEIYAYNASLDFVTRTFLPFPCVKIIAGPVPDTLPQVGSSRIAFLSIDMNCVAPEIAAAEYFWSLLVPGAVVILDDYGFASHHLQKAAFDNLALQKGVSILSLPTGQGLIFKPSK